MFWLGARPMAQAARPASRSRCTICCYSFRLPRSSTVRRRSPICSAAISETWPSGSIARRPPVGFCETFPGELLPANPQFASILYQDSGGDSYYHAWSSRCTGATTRVVTLGLSYTFSKSIDDMSVDPTGATTSGGLSTSSFSPTPTDVHNFRLDRALSDFNNTRVLFPNMLLEFPFGRHKRHASNVPGWLNPAFWDLDGRLLKTFGITKRFKAQFRAAFFNVLNHPNFASPLAASTGRPTIAAPSFRESCCLTVSLPSSANVISVGESYRVIQLRL